MVPIKLPFTAGSPDPLLFACESKYNFFLAWLRYFVDGWLVVLGLTAL